ncbi:MAG: hypothetical protein KAJ01_09450, partial [Candidatus Hydrogenedentes bacterium]|nr:hypothetical protein [Candidatus Hydrogenedentota bacterium]
MKPKGIALTALAAVLATGWCSVCAQGSDKDQDEGVLIGTNVYIRSGPTMNSYPVAKISKPAKVTVTAKVSDEWLAIQSPPGCYSVIRPKYVKLDATGNIGTITGDEVQLRAAGTLRHKDFHAIQGKLNKGDAVRIVGEVRDQNNKELLLWYIIKPPRKVRFYIARKYVRLPGDPDEEETIRPLPPDAPAPDKTPAVPPSPTFTVRKEMETLKEIRKLEKELTLESKKPIKDRNFKAILARANEFDVPEESRFRPIYDSLIDYMKDEMKLVRQAREADKLVEKVLQQAEKRKKVPAEKPKPKPKSYDIQGILSLSVLYNTVPGFPKRYVLRNPKTREIMGYVQSTKAKINLLPLEGKNVGINGTTTFDKK